jgi:hypothetical protein
MPESKLCYWFGISSEARMHLLQQPSPVPIPPWARGIADVGPCADRYRSWQEPPLKILL